MITRRQFAGYGAALAVPGIAVAQDTDIDYFQALVTLMDGSSLGYFDALASFLETRDPAFAPGLILIMRYSNVQTKPIHAALQELTGADVDDNWHNWMLWQEANPQIVPHESYFAFKRALLLSIDRNFSVFLEPRHLTRAAMKIRFEELTWGGVHKDGIPSLDNPTLIAAGDATYLNEDDLVFGVEINGDVRAYPLRIMGWHEMFNEVIGGVPVALAYCTLCGAGILFETQVPGRKDPFVFGSSGFLYRSNKLMFDRETHSLWNQYTGQPVSGALVESGLTLKQRPVTITTWAEWYAANPQTRVLSLDTGHRRNYGAGVVYSDYFASPHLMFPARVDERAHLAKDYVFGIRAPGAARAWPLAAFEGGAVINDAVGLQDVVLIGERSGRTVRAYDRKGAQFTRNEGVLVSETGTRWQETEAALISETGARLPRIAGHVSYWFAWNNYHAADSSVYGRD